MLKIIHLPKKQASICVLLLYVSIFFLNLYIPQLDTSSEDKSDAWVSFKSFLYQ